MHVYKFECDYSTLLSDNVIFFRARTLENRIPGREIEGRRALNYIY